MSFSVETAGKPRARDVKLARDFLRRLEGVTEIQHYVRVRLVPVAVVYVDGCERGFGVFVNFPRRLPIIYIGTGYRELKKHVGMTEDEFEEHLRHNLAHEVAHYEQWRDGKKLQERGVNVRATNLVRLAMTVSSTKGA